MSLILYRILNNIFSLSVPLSLEWGWGIVCFEKKHNAAAEQHAPQAATGTQFERALAAAAVVMENGEGLRRLVQNDVSLKLAPEPMGRGGNAFNG